MKLVKRIGIVISIVLVFIVIAIITDYVRYQNKKEPFFCKKTNTYWDGGSYECLGIGYKVNVYKNIMGNVERIEFGSWGMEFNKQK